MQVCEVCVCKGKCAVAANSEDPFLTSTYGVAYTRGIQEGEDRRFLQAVVTL